MIDSKGFAAEDKNSPLSPLAFQRRELSADDILIEIDYCGVCHSDIHLTRDEWGGSRYPMVPGHEIVGKVTKAGSKVTKFKVGDIAGVGCMVHSCQACNSCEEDLEQFCEKGAVYTYGNFE